MKFLVLTVLIVSTIIVSIEAKNGANLTDALAELETADAKIKNIEKNHNYGRKLRVRADLRNVNSSTKQDHTNEEKKKDQETQKKNNEAEKNKDAEKKNKEAEKKKKEAEKKNKEAEKKKDLQNDSD